MLLTGRSIGGLFLLVKGYYASKSRFWRCGWERNVAQRPLFEKSAHLLVESPVKKAIPAFARTSFESMAIISWVIFPLARSILNTLCRKPVLDPIGEWPPAFSAQRAGKHGTCRYRSNSRPSRECGCVDCIRGSHRTSGSQQPRRGWDQGDTLCKVSPPPLVERPCSIAIGFS